jgi:hypothetical protein
MLLKPLYLVTSPDWFLTKILGLIFCATRLEGVLYSEDFHQRCTNLSADVPA